MKTLNRTEPFLYAANTKSSPGKLIIHLVIFETVELDNESGMDMDKIHFSILDTNRVEAQSIARLVNETKQ